jgi:hypothetical protein
MRIAPRCKRGGRSLSLWKGESERGGRHEGGGGDQIRRRPPLFLLSFLSKTKGTYRGAGPLGGLGGHRGARGDVEHLHLCLCLSWLLAVLTGVWEEEERKRESAKEVARLLVQRERERERGVELGQAERQSRWGRRARDLALDRERERTSQRRRERERERERESRKITLPTLCDARAAPGLHLQRDRVAGSDPTPISVRRGFRRRLRRIEGTREALANRVWFLSALFSALFVVRLFCSLCCSIGARDG